MAIAKGGRIKRMPRSKRSAVIEETAKKLAVGLREAPTDLPEPDLRANALTVLSHRYLIKGPDRKPVETPKQLFWRVASHVASAEKRYPGGNEAKVDYYAREFYHLMASRKFMPNSPCLMNAGREMGMLSACFVIPVGDSIDEIFSSIKATALIQKAGGGTGFDFSRLRPKGDIVHTSGGTTEGPLSFIQVFSAATNAIQQGAFRRGANMGILRVDHPDVLEFITFKDDLSRLTNYNISVTVSDRFLRELRADRNTVHTVRNPRTGEEYPLEREGRKYTVGEIWDTIVDHAWKTGEPGVVFIDRINSRNPIKNVGLIEATNPCGEQPLHGWDSCNLGSINVGYFVQEGGDGKPQFDWEGYKEATHLSTRFLDNVIEVNNYPIPEIDEMSKRTRRIGLGVMGFADALYRLGIPYNSEEGCRFGERVMKALNDESHNASERLASERGVFPAWKGSDWEKAGRRVRNSYTTTVAPTGTISIIANCSGGIEPMFSLAFYRQVLDGETLVEANEVFVKAAKERGFFSDELMRRIAKEGTLERIAEIPEDVKKVFVCAHDITPEWHMRMQAAFQRHTDSSISKTINFPNAATVEDVRSIYELAIDLDVKGVTVYRDGCRDRQPMALEHGVKDKAKVGLAPASNHDDATAHAIAEEAELVPARLPEIMPSLRVRQRTPFGNMHVKISVDPKSEKEQEVFAQLGKGGDVANSDLEAICRLLSLFLRCGGSLTLALKQLEGIGSSLTIPTKEGRIMSLADGLSKAIRKYLAAKNKFGLKALLLGEVPAEELANGETKAAFAKAETSDVARFKVRCPACSEVLAFEEGCVKCYGCGFSQC